MMIPCRHYLYPLQIVQTYIINLRRLTQHEMGSFMRTILIILSLELPLCHDRMIPPDIHYRRLFVIVTEKYFYIIIAQVAKIMTMHDIYQHQE